MDIILVKFWNTFLMKSFRFFFCRSRFLINLEYSGCPVPLGVCRQGDHPYWPWTRNLWRSIGSFFFVFLIPFEANVCRQMLAYYCPYGFEPPQGRVHSIPLSRRVQESEMRPFRDPVPQEGLGQTQGAGPLY